MKPKTKHFILFLIVFTTFAFSLIFNPQIFAKRGCCSSHDGVCCSCGSQSNGKVICNDGNRGSSCNYSEMVKCSGHSSSSSNNQPSKTNQKPVIQVQPTSMPTQIVYPTARPTRRPTKRPTAIPTPKPTTVPCSANKDSICPSHCNAGNDADCCKSQLNNYQWYQDWGCYPEKLSCSAKADGICDWYCTAGNDADCCSSKLDGYAWFNNWGCYPKEEAQCSAVKDGVCPDHCEAGHDYDCCYQRLEGYEWYENWGCYKGK